MVHFHHINHTAADFFRQLAEIAIQLAHLQPEAALNNSLLAAVALGIIRIQHSHHFILVREDKALCIGHFHGVSPEKVIRGMVRIIALLKSIR